MKTLKYLIFIIMLEANNLCAQSLSVEAGISKHFASKGNIVASKYDEPNLEVQVKHIINTRFSYVLSYYNIKQYWDIPFHEFNQWTSPPELYYRSTNGLDLTCNLNALLLNQDNKISFLVGPSVRRRSELFYYDCHHNGFWYECLPSSSLLYDIGCNLMLDADFLIWKQFGLSGSTNYRFYKGSISSLSLNAGVFYQFSLGKSMSE